VENLKKNLLSLEGKIAEARTKKDMLKARAQAAQAQAQLQGAVGGLNTDSAMAAFDRMEEKVLSLEARGQAAAELAGADLDSRFQALEAGGDVDQELAALKASLSPTPLALPDDSKKPELLPAQAAEVDDELEKLKRSIDNL
jgi:phage shock protein A